MGELDPVLAADPDRGAILAAAVSDRRKARPRRRPGAAESDAPESERAYRSPWALSQNSWIVGRMMISFTSTCGGRDSANTNAPATSSTVSCAPWTGSS